MLAFVLVLQIGDMTPKLIKLKWTFGAKRDYN